MSIAERRHHTARIKQKFYNKQKHLDLWATDERSAGKYANHGKVCSCWMCGNPRKLGELTIQELKHIKQVEVDGSIEDVLAWEKQQLGE